MNRYMLALVVTVVLVGGCQTVSPSEHAELRERCEILVKHNEQLADANRELKARCKQLVRESTSRGVKLDAAMSLIDDLNKKKPPEAPGSGLETNPDTGGIVLEGEIMFAAGSSNLAPEGKATLKQLAALLNSEKYCNYLVRVDGHTDDVPVTKTIRVNKDNWFLSARRAHSVLVELKRLDVGAERLFLAAYGQNRPMVPNPPGRKGTPANRRVEIMLVEKAGTEKEK